MMTDGNEMSADAYEPYDFANRRHIGPSPDEIAEMLQVVGVSSLDALIDETVPSPELVLAIFSRFCAGFRL
jgi:hypothetical protein